MSGEPPRKGLFVWLGIVFECSLGLLGWGLGWLSDVPVLAKLRWNGHDALLGTVATLPMLLLFLACLRWPVGPLARLKQLSEDILRPLFSSCSLFELGLLSLAAGLSEELLFRGFLQDYLVPWIGFWQGLVVSSVVFGLLHLITPTYAVLASLLGLYLGWLFAVTGNLLTVVVAHGLYDFLALAYLLRLSQPARPPA